MRKDIMQLLSFSVANYKSFNGKQTIDFHNDSHNTNAILGPNGSGKSNLFDAILFVCEFVKNSTKFYGQQELGYAPFLYNTESPNKPTSFEIKAKLSSSTKNLENIYQYSFSILNTKIVRERLKINNKTIFSRKSICNGHFQENGFGNDLLKKTSEQALILTKAWEDENKYAKKVFEIISKIKLLRGDINPNLTAKNILNNEYFKKSALNFLQRADLAIQDIKVIETKMPDDLYNKLPFNDEFKKNIDRTGYNINTAHFIRNETSKVESIEYIPMQLESIGTRRIFELTFPLLNSLENGFVLYIDDFESFLHPKECEFIISLFNSKENKSGAKLIINTHNDGVMNQIGKDNLYLFGKNSREETIINKIKGIRSDDTNIEKKYKAGIFGATPNIRW